MLNTHTNTNSAPPLSENNLTTNSDPTKSENGLTTNSEHGERSKY
ncbi:MAG: hypothetical protein ACI8ZM_002158 [Crocinitomix sp.]|jgi:hypothetical protein